MRPGGLQSARQNERNHLSASTTSESGFSSCFRTVPGRCPGVRVDSAPPCSRGAERPVGFCSTVLSPRALLRHQQLATCSSQRRPRGLPADRSDAFPAGWGWMKHSETLPGLRVSWGQGAELRDFSNI